EQDNNNLLGGARPLYSFQGMFQLANSAPVFLSLNADPATGQPADAQRYFRTGTYAGFIQDDWKLTPELTLNLGLRYEYFTPLREKRGRISNLVFGPNGLADARVVVQDELFQPDRNNWAPRFGFAYNPDWFGRKLVARGGFGLFYNRIPNVLFSNTRGNPPFFARYSLCCGNAENPFLGGQINYALGADRSPLSYPVNPELAVGIDPETGAPRDRDVEIRGSEGKLTNGYVYIYSFDLQYSLPAQFVASLGYQGSAGHKLIRLVNQNYLFTNNPNFFAVYFPRPDVNSNFNAMLLSLSRRMSNGLQFDVSYRFSKSIDTLSYEGPGGVTNQTFPQDLASERGPSDFDSTHYFVFSGLYELPMFRSQQGLLGKLLGGFQLNGVVTAHTGFPWTPVTGQSVTTPGGPTLAPTRPIAYFGGALNDSSDEAFMPPGGNFPGGGRNFFDISTGGPPGIGRNSFRGPHYFSTDLSIAKQTRLPFVSETAMLDLRANMFNVFNQLNLQPLTFGSDNARIENDVFFGFAPGGMAGRVVEFQARFSF
ncbi:MAG: TonB-dependent receptor domain-containing protein, partial [Bryobacteraceae bacterium]